MEKYITIVFKYSFYRINRAAVLKYLKRNLKRQIFILLILTIVNIPGIRCSNVIKDSSEPELITPLGRKCYSLPGVDSALYSLYVGETLDRQSSNILYNEGLLYAQFWRYHDAVECFTKCIEKKSNVPLYWRMRGHRYISLRMFEKAVNDLKKAAELILPGKDKDLEWNIFYHLGLAYYLSRDFEKALKTYNKCLNISETDDTMVAAANWVYNTLIRLRRLDEAEQILYRIKTGLKVKDNVTYYNSMFFHQGKMTEESLLNTASNSLDSLTVSYSIGIKRLAEGGTAGAQKIFEKIVEGFYWPAFGFIAAETHLVHVRK
ncbi:tetratricopeptide repeat protein [candidate division KSB1 bacterium]